MIDRCTQKKWVPDGRRSKRFTLQIYEKQRVRASSPCILFPYHPQQKHADARGVAWWERSQRNVPTLFHSDPQRRRQAVEHVHQAVEGVDTVCKAEDANGAAYQHATRRVSRSVAGVDQNPLASRHLHQARQSRPPSRRPSGGASGQSVAKPRRGAAHIRPREWPDAPPEAGGSSVAMGDCPLSAGKNSTPSVPPGRWAVRRKRINVDIWKKLT